jgi:hypothetical protein
MHSVPLPSHSTMRMRRSVVVAVVAAMAFVVALIPRVVGSSSASSTLLSLDPITALLFDLDATNAARPLTYEERVLAFTLQVKQPPVPHTTTATRTIQT